MSWDEDVIEILGTRVEELLADGHEPAQVIEDLCSEYPDVDRELIEELVSGSSDEPTTDHDGVETHGVSSDED